jgi:hypothetical protein
MIFLSWNKGEMSRIYHLDDGAEWLVTSDNCSWIHRGIYQGTQLVVGSPWLRSVVPVEEEIINGYSD